MNINNALAKMMGKNSIEGQGKRVKNMTLLTDVKKLAKVFKNPYARAYTDNLEKAHQEGFLSDVDFEKRVNDIKKRRKDSH